MREHWRALRALKVPIFFQKSGTYVERVSHPLGGPCMRRTKRRRSAVSRFKIIKKRTRPLGRVQPILRRYASWAKRACERAAVGRTESDLERQSAEALARLIKKKRKALGTFLLKVGVLFGC